MSSLTMCTPPVTPSWFTNAIAVTPKHQSLIVDDASIHYQTWGDSNKPGLLFVHGHAAHAHWWDFIAPEFQQQFYVGAMDMAGNGDSEHRDKYLASQFGKEIAVVASNLSQQTIVVAHSFGGSMARVAAQLFPENIAGLILIDSVISDRKRSAPPPKPLAPPRIRSYKSVFEAQRRFRLRPPQPRPEAYILDHLSKHSVKQVGDGYQFKLDPQVFDKMWPEDYPDAATMVQQLTMPKGYIFGTKSRFCPPEALDLLRSIYQKEHLLGVQDAHHHLFLDQPLEFIKTLKQLLVTLQLADPHQW